LLIKLLLLLLVILIALFLIIFLEPVHIAIDIKFLDELKNGFLEIKYYFIKITRNITEGYTTISFDTKYFSKDLKVIYPKSNDDGVDNADNAVHSDEVNSDDVDESEISQNNSEADDNSNENNLHKVIDLIKTYYPDVLELKNDIIEIIFMFKEIIFLGDNYINLDIGLADNNLTIKISSFLWSLTAPFYAVGLNTIIKPVMNEPKLNLDSRLDFELSLLVLLKILLKILSNTKLVKLIIRLFKEMN